MPYSAGYAIAGITELKALQNADLVNGYARWVISKNSWYGWDANSAATGNDDSVVAISSVPATGRFLRSVAGAPPANTAYTDVAQQFTKTQGTATLALTDAANILVDGSLSNKFSVVLGGNRALANPINLKEATYIFTIKQDATGSRTLTYGSNFKFPGGILPVLSTAINAVDELYCNSDGLVLRCVLNKDYK